MIIQLGVVQWCLEVAERGGSGLLTLLMMVVGVVRVVRVDEGSEVEVRQG